MSHVNPAENYFINDEKITFSSDMEFRQIQWKGIMYYM